MDKEKEKVRIISQDRLNDIPYDFVMVFLNHLNRKEVCASFMSDTDKGDYTLGTYNNEKDALYVMDCIRYNKKKGYEYFHMPDAESVSAWRKKATEGGEL